MLELSQKTALESRLGHVGFIQAFDLWWGRESLENCYSQVATIAGLSHGNENPKNPKGLFDQLVNAKPVPHGEPLECIPFEPLFNHKSQKYLSIRPSSLRHYLEVLKHEGRWCAYEANFGRFMHPATAFRVTMPEMVYIHWLRHGATFGKNVLSRRKVPDEKVEVRFYGEEWAAVNDPDRLVAWEAQRAEYRRRRARGEALELARTAFGNDQFIDFWIWGFDRDWGKGSAFNLQRVEDPKAQAEIKVFAKWIEDFIEGKKRPE